MSTTESFDSLWSYCTANNRVCPMPQRWADLFEKLKGRERGKPALPLILAAWHDTPALQKVVRFREHIEWAREHRQLDEIGVFVRGLREDDWFHCGE